VGVGSSIGSLSSRDIRFSAAVKLPCDNGDGRAGRGSGVKVDVAEAEEDVVSEIVVADDGGESAEDLVVAVDPDEDVDVEVFRLCGIRSWPVAVEGEDDAGDGVLRLELGNVEGLFRPRTLPLADGILWPLLPLWLLFVRWR
jgi:hypothetical protein